jgi:hypothetical protein
MKLWCLSGIVKCAQGDSVGLSRLGNVNLKECFYSTTHD